MADTLTANVGLTKVEISGSPDTWGDKWNANADKIDLRIGTIEATATTDRAAAVKRDGTASFTAKQQGVTPISSDPATTLATKEYVDNRINANMPIGGIIMWSGVTVPAGFALCDGSTSNGIPTPNLRDKFIIGAGGAYPTGATGGAATHTHGGGTGGTILTIAQMPLHTHGIIQTPHAHALNQTPHSHGYHIMGQLNNLAGGGSGLATVVATNTQTDDALINITMDPQNANITVVSEGGGGSHAHPISADSHIPPYYALAFIMRVA